MSYLPKSSHNLGKEPCSDAHFADQDSEAAGSIETLVFQIHASSKG